MTIFNPIERALAAKARGELTADLEDDAAAAVLAVATATLRDAGLPDSAVDQLFDRPFEIRATADPHTGDLAVTIQFLDDPGDLPVIRA